MLLWVTVFGFFLNYYDFKHTEGCMQHLLPKDNLTSILVLT